MKKYTLHLLIISLSLLAVACKKEKSPELEITVVNATTNEAVRQAVVVTSVPGANQGIINQEVIDSVRTNEFGKAYFKYDNTILLRIGAYYNKVLLDSTDILLETKRLKSGEDNYYERTMRIDI